MYPDILETACCLSCPGVDLKGRMSACRVSSLSWSQLPMRIAASVFKCMLYRDVVSDVSDPSEAWAAQGAPTHRGAKPMERAVGQPLHRSSSKRASSPVRAAGQALGGGACCSDTGVLCGSLYHALHSAPFPRCTQYGSCLLGRPKPSRGCRSACKDIPEWACGSCRGSAVRAHGAARPAGRCSRSFACAPQQWGA